LVVAVALDSGFDQPHRGRELAVLLQSIDSLLADYLRRSIVNGDQNVPLSVLIRDLHDLLEAAGRPAASVTRASEAAAKFRQLRRTG
jgi:hypothetical protein